MPDKVSQTLEDQKHQLSQIRSLASKVLDDAAVERLMVVVSTKKEGLTLAQQALSIAMKQVSQYGRKLNEEQFKRILLHLSMAGKKEGNITIYHK